jgi:hypothetical protein
MKYFIVVALSLLAGCALAEGIEHTLWAPQTYSAYGFTVIEFRNNADGANCYVVTKDGGQLNVGISCVRRETK